MGHVKSLVSSKTLTLIFGILVSLWMSPKVACQGTSPTDDEIYKSPCTLITDSVAVYKKWSDPGTWESGIVPGVGDGTDIDAVVPCDVAVQLDLPNITVGILQVKGLLRFLDDPDLGDIYVKARHVLVEGRLAIGTSENQFSQLATIELTPSPERDELQFTSFSPADGDNPRFLGHKAFAVVGGQVDLHGMPGNSATPSWCQLAATALAGNSTIVVDNELAIDWPVGGQVVVATTDYHYSQTESFKITSVTVSSDGHVVIGLDSPLVYSHNGVQVSDGMGGWIDQRGEVALISRNIVITGTDEEAPYKLEGGHFFIFRTPDPPQFIEGVEFYKMGQQGRLGRYSMHFHVIGNSPQTIAVKNSINQSKQRCLVVHATHNITIKENVAFNTSGHCFSLEEGGEQNNTFDSNIAITGNRATKFINGETDVNPALYWISAPGNILINNRAVGSLDSGFWWDTRKTVRGNSKNIASLRKINPDETPVLLFKGNVAHSCHNVGMKTYPDGFRPVKSTVVNKLEDNLIYKQVSRGMLIHLTQSLTISGTFADCGVGILILESRAIHVTNSRFVGLTTNYGNPTSCTKKDARGFYSTCMPRIGCDMPLASNDLGRTHSGYLTDPYYGVQISQERRITGHTLPNKVSYSKFSNYNSSCTKPGRSAAIIPVRPAILGSSFNPQFSLRGLQFYDSNSLYFPPETAFYEAINGTTYLGEVAKYIVMKDLDGSVIGHPGTIVANNAGLIPQNKCTFFQNLNAYGCTGTCYRTVRVYYGEPGFEKSSKPKNQPGDFSSLRFTRLSDSQSLVITGNLNDVLSTKSFAYRVFFLTLLVGETYDITVVPPDNNNAFFPTFIQVKYLDSAGSCDDSVRLRFLPPPNLEFQYTLNMTTNPIWYRSCEGTGNESAAGTKAQYTYTCQNELSLLDVELPPQFDDKDTLTIVPQSGSQACQSDLSCSILLDLQNTWLWDASGAERRPNFYDPSASTDYFNSSGSAVFGYNNKIKGLSTFLPKPSQNLITYYFRNSFSLDDSACYTSLSIDLYFEDGIVLYLNGKEILRSNMPEGTVSSTTLALTKTQAWMKWQRFSLTVPGPLDAYSLVDGTNTVAAEVHVFSSKAKRMLFDMRIVGEYTKLSNVIKFLPIARSTPKPQNPPMSVKNRTTVDTFVTNVMRPPSRYDY